MTKDKPTVLICLKYYLPGYKSGGPVKSLQAMAETLSNDFAFKIITYDRDAGDDEPYPHIEHMKWQPLGSALVYYLPKSWISSFRMATLLRTVEADLLYVQSLYSLMFAFLPAVMYWLGLTRCRRFLLAPRGELAPGALSIHPVRKKAYIAVTRWTGLFSNVRWHASSSKEATEIEQTYKSSNIYLARSISFASNQISLPQVGSSDSHKLKANLDRYADFLRVLFVARICPNKNLDFAIRALAKCTRRINFSIYGPTDCDPQYWQTCQALLNELPSNVTATYFGPASPDTLPAVYESHDLLLFPTKGESFGHVIAESLQHGCPVLISDRTQWQEVSQYGVGWVFSLDDMHAFSTTIDVVASWEIAEIAELRRRTFEYASKRMNSEEDVERNRDMLSLSCQV